MSSASDDVALRWIVDALDDEERSRVEVSEDVRRMKERLLDVIEPEAPSASARDRLVRSLAGPHRFLPFLDEASALFDMEPDAMMQVFERTEHTEAWQQTGVPGVSFEHFAAGPALGGADSGLVRFAPGACFPSHQHHGRELTFVLQGRITFSDGVTLGPGEQRLIRGGSHSVEAGDEEVLYLTFHEGFSVLPDG